MFNDLGQKNRIYSTPSIGYRPTLFVFNQPQPCRAVPDLRKAWLGGHKMVSSCQVKVFYFEQGYEKWLEQSRSIRQTESVI